METRETPFVPIGTNVKGYGKVSAILITSGERYYLLTGKKNTVSLMPANIIEE